MTDEQHAKAIQAASEALRQAIDAAFDAGLDVETRFSLTDIMYCPRKRLRGLTEVIVVRKISAP